WFTAPGRFGAATVRERERFGLPLPNGRGSAAASHAPHSYLLDRALISVSSSNVTVPCVTPRGGADNADRNLCSAGDVSTLLGIVGAKRGSSGGSIVTVPWIGAI